MLLTKLSKSKSNIEYMIPVYFKNIYYMDIKGNLNYDKCKGDNSKIENSLKYKSVRRTMELLVFKHKIGKQSKNHNTGVIGLTPVYKIVKIDNEDFKVIDKILITEKDALRKLRDFKLSKLGIL